jgi:hypothetical protein
VLAKDASMFPRAVCEAAPYCPCAFASVPYLEPVISQGSFRKLNPSIYSGISYSAGICPVAEKIQPQIMQFKTNYRDPGLAAEKAHILAKTIKKVKSA